MNLQGSYLRILALASKEWREVLRDRIFFALAFFLPFMLMFVFTYGASQDVEHVPFMVADEDHTALSREYAQQFIASRYFEYRGSLESRGASGYDRVLVGGKIRFVLVIPARFEERLLAGRTTQVQTLFDATFIRSIRTAESYVEAINAEYASRIARTVLARRSGLTAAQVAAALQPLRVETRYLFNKEIRTIWAIAPAMILLILTLTAPLLTAIAVVREKETGSIYNIYSSTITRAEFLAGKLVPYVVISFINGVILFLLAVGYFRVPFKGSLPFFLLAMFLYVLCTSGLGLLFSLVVRTQLAALMVSVIVSMTFVFQFGGIFTPISSMTGFPYVFAHLVPPMYFNDIIEGTFHKGMGGGVLWADVAVLAVYTAVTLFLAHRFFHKRVPA